MSLNKTHGVGGIKEMTLRGNWPSSSQRCAGATEQEVGEGCMAGAVGSGGINLDGLTGLG